jgi:hypothetical protein
MAWTYGAVRVYVSDRDEGKKQLISRLQPLNNKTILHRFGYESEITSFRALVATSGDKNTLRDYLESGSSYTLSGPEGILGDFFPASFKAKRTDSTNITLSDRPGLDGIIFR